MKLDKAKQVVKDHKTEIKGEVIRVIYYTVGVGIGMVAGKAIGKNITTAKLDQGIAKAVKEGYIVLTKPSENGVITKLSYEEWSKVFREHHKK